MAHSMWFYPFVVAICVVTSQFSLWLLHLRLIYMRCVVVTLSTKKQKKTWPRGNPEKKENTLKFVGFVLNAPISKFQSKCCWKSWLNWENVHFVASCKFFKKKNNWMSPFCPVFLEMKLIHLLSKLLFEISSNSISMVFHPKLKRQLAWNKTTWALHHS